MSDIGAAALGVVWLVGRLAYAAGYARAVEKRRPGLFIQAIACVLLFLGAAVGMMRHLIGGWSLLEVRLSARAQRCLLAHG